MIWIAYTTRYRDGGPELIRAARTMAAQLSCVKNTTVRCEPVESKAEFLAAVQTIKNDGFLLQELHFLGHSGMYGPMFGTIEWPEQFSPHEWRTMHLPFAPDGTAFFHACRTARWFAPFFANTHGVTTHGYHWYTSFSTHPRVFRWQRYSSRTHPLYLVGCPGRKSHGLSGSVAKYSGLLPTERLKRFTPQTEGADGSYNEVARLYDEVFDDIRVRRDEWRWMKQHLPQSGEFNILDIGCGNGAFLRAISEEPTLAAIKHGVGLDRSKTMIECAQEKTTQFDALSFASIDEPILPYPDNFFDVVTSLLSLRYLDWDPIFAEIRRVLKPSGKILIIDMVSGPLKKREWPKLLTDAARAHFQRRKNIKFQTALRTLVSHPEWRTMLSFNPIRSEHEMKWYLNSRFPEGQFEVLNLGLYSRVVAFDTGPLESAVHEPLSYP